MPTIHDAFEHHKQGRLEKAEAVYQQLLAAAPGDSDALHYFGVLRMSQGRRDEAIDLVTRALKIAPLNPDAWNSLGNMVAATGKPNAPEYAFKRALELKPDYLEAWYNLGNHYRRHRRREEALNCFRRVLDLNPRITGAYENCAMLLHRMGRPEEANAAFKAWHAADPDNPIARHMALAYAHEAPPRADDAYVVKMFDKMSGYFDESLGRLGYAAPALLSVAVAEFIPYAEGRLVVLDAGCGTGLCGPLLRSSARRLVGVDLSSGMLARARERAVYDELHEGELVAFMAAHPAAFDLVLSADTLVYFGPLEAAFAAAASTLKPGALFAFTLEAEPADSTEKHRLHPHGRYSHGAAYVRDCLAAAGFELLQLEDGVLRKETGADVHGHVTIARKKSLPGQ